MREGVEKMRPRGEFMKRAHLSVASVLVALGTGVQAETVTPLPEINVTVDTPASGPAPAVRAASGASSAPTVAPTAASGVDPVIDTRPYNSAHIDATQIQRAGSPLLGDVLEITAPGVTLQSTTGSPLSPDVEYRGFLSSPTSGTPQGLAVYQNGVRINEAFGDEVNWDLIPTLAIASMDLISNNPAYGLNALAGALNVKMKNGFIYQGGKLEIGGGSYGRGQAGFDYGRQFGQFALYGALEYVHDNLYRYHGNTNIGRFYGDLGYRNDGHEIHLNVSLASTGLGVAGSSPIEMARQNWAQTYTTPQTTLNQMGMVNLTGEFTLSPSWTLNANAYVRRFLQSHVDGNPSDAQSCDPAAGFGADAICFGDPTNQAIGGNGAPIYSSTLNTAGQNNLIGEIDRTWVRTTSLGAAFQLNNNDTLFGFRNRASFGASFDYGMSSFVGSAELGVVQPNYVVQGSGVYLGDNDDIGPTNVRTINRYFGLYALDAFDVNDKLTISGGGRLNFASLSLSDLLGGNAGGEHQYAHVNPVIGFTYRLTPELQAYGSYAMSNRAPTPLELACSDPNHPCVIQSFLVSDPELKQVVAQTFEGGLRGQNDFGSYGALSWKAGAFSIRSSNDIYNIIDLNLSNQGYFANIGGTLRQGAETSLNYRYKDVTLRASCTYIYATFQSAFQLNSFAPSYAAAGGVENVAPGNEMPMIPRHRVKLGADWDITPKARIGGDLLFVGSQRYVGDEANQNAKLPAYFTLNLHAAYKVADNVEVFARGTNILDRRYYLFGTYFDTSALYANYTDSRSVTPAQPLSVYGGVRVSFDEPKPAPAAVLAKY